MAISLGDLPCACLARILSFTSPADVKRLAFLSKLFLESATFDLVWEKFLPPHWRDLFGASSIVGLSLLEIFQKLCAGVFEGSENRILMLDPPSGKIRRIVSARALNIVWGDDRRYWLWRPSARSRFGEVAYLVAVCWLELNGSCRGRWKTGTYTVSFLLKIVDDSIHFGSSFHYFLDEDSSHCHTEDEGEEDYSHSEEETSEHDEEHSHYCSSEEDDLCEEHYRCWRVKPVKFSLSVDEAVVNESSAFLGSSARPSYNGFGRYDVGQFVVNDDPEVALNFSMIEIEGGHWKNGLLVEGVLISQN